MKTNLLKLAALALLPAALLTFTSCSTPGVYEETATLEKAGGAAIVDTFKATATVTAIDAATRKVTLKLADGGRKTIKCGPAVANFAQIEINDRVSVTITEELAVFLGAGSPPSAAGATTVALAPIGAKPGGMMADTVQVTAKIAAIDVKNRKVTQPAGRNLGESQSRQAD
jgi:Cu/Ag efflux protein CusF